MNSDSANQEPSAPIKENEPAVAPAKAKKLSRPRLMIAAFLGVVLCLFTLVEANFTHLQEISLLAIFAMLGMVLCFIQFPLKTKWLPEKITSASDYVLAALTVICCGFVVFQSEQIFESIWLLDMRLGDRAGAETVVDSTISIIGMLLVLECTRRAIGWVVPVLATVFVLHSLYCYASQQYGLPSFPDFMLPHPGQSPTRLANSAFYHQGVFGQATKVMFYYVFLFVIFGTFLEISGATQFIIDFSEKVFGRSPSGPAKVSVLGSGLMGSLSGSAVANAMTTGSFTIPMMRNAGFDKAAAGGITAAAASGGALVPPVMGAGAYMMLEIVEPQVEFVQIMRAAIIPSLLYYFSLLMIVTFYSRRMGTRLVHRSDREPTKLNVFDGVVFFAALSTLVGLLIWQFTAFKAVSASLVVIFILTTFRSELSDGTKLTQKARIAMWVTFGVGVVIGLIINDKKLAIDQLFSAKQSRPNFTILLDAALIGFLCMIALGLFHTTWRREVRNALRKSSKGAIALVAASACVGIIIAVVNQTGIATAFSQEIKGVVNESLFVALIGIMLCSIVLGMGVPSVVCYLLMATLMGSLLQELGVIPLGAHLFIFYFGMMSMVTPPVALAAYASASIAKAKIMETAFAAFRFALVGFTLPFMFVYRPALLLMNEGSWNDWFAIKDDITVADDDKVAALAEANSAWPEVSNMVIALLASVVGIVAIAACIAGYLRARMSGAERACCFIAAALLLIPYISIGDNDVGGWVNLIGGVIFALVYGYNFWKSKRATGDLSDSEATERKVEPDEDDSDDD